MIVGKKNIFAIESHISQVNSNLSLRALGCFIIHINAYSYGVHNPDATYLACSVDEVALRITRKGQHRAHFTLNYGADYVANAFYRAIYDPDEHDYNYFNISKIDLLNDIHTNHLIWAPDGDAAFDDGSYVLQFDFENKVRLIGFQVTDNNYQYDAHSLREVWIDRNDFYNILIHWARAFDNERNNRLALA